MAHAYVTYFDRNYAVKGIAMIQSLLEHDPGSTINVVCLDADTFRLLAMLGIDGLVPVRLETVEAGDAALAAAKTNRSRVEYYWTMTPAVMLRFLRNMPTGSVLTYVDADLLFFSSLEPVFQELGEKSVLIHGHNFPPQYAHFAVNGIYNVGLVSVRNDVEGLNVLEWWRERCIEWCYARCEDGKMGDQKYLESFPSLTDQLAIARNPGIGVGPWNYMGYALSAQGGVPCVNGFAVVFFHYHSAAMLAPGAMAPCTDLSYPLTQQMLRLFAIPYLKRLDAAFDRITGIQPNFRYGLTKGEDIDVRMCLVIEKRMAPDFRAYYPCVVPLGGNYCACASVQFPEGLERCAPMIPAGGPGVLAQPGKEAGTVSVEGAGSRIRVLQVEDFYPAYLEAFYQANPAIAHKPSREQAQALLRDGFSAIHAVAPYLPEDTFETDYSVCQALPMHLAWCRERGQEFPANDPDWQREMLRRRIREFRPDVLYLGDPVQYDGQFLATLDFRPRVIMAWKAADLPATIDLKGYDIILSGLPKLLAFAERQGAGRGVMFKPGMPDWLAKAVSGTAKTVDVCFAGSLFPAQHVHRLAMLDSVAQAAAGHGFSLALHLNCDPRLISPAMKPYLRPPVFGLAMQQALASARIVVDDRAWHGVIMPDGGKKLDLGGEDTINMRMFEATGSGSLLLTQKLAGVGKYFEPGREVDVWEDHDELIQKVLFWLGHEQQREQLALAGLTRCLNDHNMNIAAGNMEKIILEALKA